MPRGRDLGRTESLYGYRASRSEMLLPCCDLTSLEEGHTTYAQRQRLHQWVRRFIPRAAETPGQQRLVLHDD